MIEEKKILSLFDPKDKKILDVGCGDGRYSEIFSTSCKKYVGIDLNEEMINKNNLNNHNSNTEYIHGNIINYKPNDKFDVIILSLSFHEIDIKEQGIALMNMLSLLEKDGEIIILDPAFENDSFQALWNVAYNCLKFYNHDYSVNHSREVIDKAVENNLCYVSKKDNVSIPFEFPSIDKILEMIINDEDFQSVKWSENNRHLLKTMLKYFLKKEKNIVIYDKLDITVLKKSGD